MRPFGRLTRARALVVAALLAVCGATALHFTGAVDDLERSSVAARFQVRHAPAPKDIVVVGVDDLTFSDLEQQWPFPRSLHARVIDRLRAAGAGLIVYDVQFTEPTKPAEDLALYHSLGRAKNAVLATTESDEHGRTNVLGGDRNLAAIGARAASTSLPVDPGGMKTHFGYSVSNLRTLAVTAAARAGGPPLGLGDFPSGGAWIDYRGPAGTFPFVSFSDVLRGHFAPGSF